MRCRPLLRWSRITHGRKGGGATRRETPVSAGNLNIFLNNKIIIIMTAANLTLRGASIFCRFIFCYGIIAVQCNDIVLLSYRTCFHDKKIEILMSEYSM